MLDLRLDAAIYSGDADTVHTAEEVHPRPDRVASGRVSAPVSRHERQKDHRPDCRPEPCARQNGSPEFRFFPTQEPAIAFGYDPDQFVWEHHENVNAWEAKIVQAYGFPKVEVKR